ncbi:MAG: hypothetical protein ACOYO1_11400 [Bacteroidales bacterium]
MYKVISILIVVFLFHFNTSAQKKLALTNDKDGFTNIRAGMGSEFDIIGQIKTDVFFYCEKNKTEWYIVDAPQFNENGFQNGKQLNGFIHKSHVRFIEEMPLDEQKKIISSVFIDFKKLNDKKNQFQLTQGKNTHFKNKTDSLKSIAYSYSMFSNFDTKYESVLMFFPSYYCKSKDTLTLNLLFAAIWSNFGSVDEQHCNTLCDSYLCDEKLFLSSLSYIKKKAELKFLIEETDIGLCFNFDVDYKGKSIKNTTYLRLIKQLRNLTKRKPVSII